MPGYLPLVTCCLLSLVVPSNCKIGQDCNETRTCTSFGELCINNAGRTRCECRTCYHASGTSCVKSGNCASSSGCGRYGNCTNCQCACNSDYARVNGKCVNRISDSSIIISRSRSRSSRSRRRSRSRRYRVGHSHAIIIPSVVAGVFVFFCLSCLCCPCVRKRNPSNMAYDTVNYTAGYSTFQNEPDADESQSYLPKTTTQYYQPPAYPPVGEGYQPPAYPPPPLGEGYQPPEYRPPRMGEGYQSPVYPSPPAAEGFQPSVYPAPPMAESYQPPVYPTAPATEGYQPPAYPAPPVTERDQPPAYPTPQIAEGYRPPSCPTPDATSDHSVVPPE